MRLAAQILLSNTQRVCNKKRRDNDSRGDFAVHRDDPAVTHSLRHLGFHRGRSEFTVVHGDGGG